MTSLSPADVINFLNNMTEADAVAIYESIRYVGFNRNEIIKELESKSASLQVVANLSVIGAVRGGNLDKIKTETLPTDTQNFIKRYVKRSARGKGSKELSLLRITAAFPQLAAHVMEYSKVPKKIESSNLPAALQFPAAGSLPLKSEYRTQHLEFCKEFSALIKGEFQQSIYDSMLSNIIPKSECPNSIHKYLQ